MSRRTRHGLGAALLLALLAGPTGVRAEEPPAGAIRLSAPGTLRAAGATYLLTRDVVAKGTGFVIAAKGVTLDLGGHKLTYGTGPGQAFGVASRYQYGAGRITVENGRIVQGAGGGSACHGVDFAGGHELRIEDLEVDVHGPDACGINLYQEPTGAVTIAGCRVACRTTVVGNRHYPGVAAIRLADVHTDTEIVGNTVTASPQWGIQVAGEGAKTTCRIHANVVRGTKALVANGYMIGVHRRNVEVFDNVLAGESRGIHVDGVDHEGFGANVHHNRILAQDQPNAEFTPHWCHGIKLEDTRATLVHHNYVRVVADATHSEALALDIDATHGGPLRVFANRFEGLSRVSGKAGKALVWNGLLGGRAEDVLVTHNVFVATDVLIQRTWESAGGTVFRENAWLRDPEAPADRPLVFERFDNQDGRASRGHGVRDPYAPGGTTQATEWANPGPYDSVRERTIRIVERRGGRALPDAPLEIRDREGRRVFQGRTDAAGRADAVIVLSRLGNGPTLDYRGPFEVRAATADGSLAQARRIHLRGPAILDFELRGGRLAYRRTHPAAPRDLAVQAGPPGRAALTWRAPPGATEVAYTLVEVGGRPWLLATGTRAELGGLPRDGRLSFTLRVVDRAGRLSPRTAPVAPDRPPR